MSKIGILGKMASGKTTLANYILNIDDEYQIYSFGDKVKSVAKDLFSMTGKNRELLQSIGEKMREIDQDVWVNYVLTQIKGQNKIIIDDVRYENEIKILKDNGFIIIYLDVSDVNQVSRLKTKYPDYDHTQFLDHESEKAEQFKNYADYEISDQDDEISYNKIVNQILST